MHSCVPQPSRGRGDDVIYVQQQQQVVLPPAAPIVARFAERAADRSKPRLFRSKEIPTKPTTRKENKYNIK